MKVGNAMSELQKDDGIKTARLISYSDIQTWEKEPAKRAISDGADDGCDK